MMRYDDEADLMGPSADLAMSLSGVLMVVVVMALIQLWVTSMAARRINHLDDPASVASRTELLSREKDLEQIVGEMAKTDKTRIDELKAAALRLGQAEASLNRLTDELTVTTKELNAEKGRVANLIAQLAEETKRREAVESSLQASTPKIVLLTRQLAEEVKRRQAVEHDLQTEGLRSAQLVQSLADEKRRGEALESDLQNANRQLARQKSELADMERRLNDKPPLITISDAKFQTFKFGSAEVSAELREFLRRSVGDLQLLRGRYNADIVEVTGHTDEMPLVVATRNRCNLDGELLGVVNGTKDAKILAPCDNIGLGMARAVAVVRELRALGMGAEFTLLPLSAGAVIDTNATLAAGNRPAVPLPERRRIEIRLRRK
jgi:flagellar motor protein MotB